MPKIVIVDDAPPVLAGSRAWAALDRGSPVELEYHDTLPGSESRLIERLQGADAAINIRSSSRFTAAVFESCPQLRVLSIWGTGTDNVDLAAARRAGVTVTNTPAVSAVSIAEHALALLFAVARQVPRIDRGTRAGEWARGSFLELRGKTAGVIGLGAVGREFARLASGVGMHVLAWTLHPNPALGVPLVDFDELLAVSDAVSVHVRLSERTKGLIGAAEFARMKRGAILINTARGPIVDEAALMEALRSGHLRGAGLDVFDAEPLPAGHPLTTLDNTVLSPHCAGMTPEALEAGLSLAVSNLFACMEGHPQNVVA
jgi:D-3-phosphoglycerate dehydrogenase